MLHRSNAPSACSTKASRARSMNSTGPSISRVGALSPSKSSTSGVGIVGGVIRVPRVLLLIAYERVPKRHVRFSRFNIYARDNNTCQYCARRLPRTELNLDHVIPRSRGGLSTWENVVCSCHSCNRRKGGQTPEEARDAAYSQAPAPAMDAFQHRDVQPARAIANGCRS